MNKLFSGTHFRTMCFRAFFWEYEILDVNHNCRSRTQNLDLAAAAATTFN